ncbi:hypothetical protein [Candidatus Nitrososphaera gargensis]|nr:hypothetical protein [Candidatus Nitrososphaera gargensis]
MSGQQINIVVTFKNYQQVEQNYALIIQVEDSNGIVTHIDWVEGKLAYGQTTQHTRQWITPTEQGLYRIKIFIWDGIFIIAPTPLSERTVENIHVSE